jgi:hypothetical protein
MNWVRNGAAVAVAAAGLATELKAETNLLAAPGFEVSGGAPDAAAGDQTTNQAGSPWLGWNNWVAPYGGFYTAGTSRTGSQAGKTFSGANGGLYQFVPATAGKTYVASGWFLNKSGDEFRSAEQADVRMTFFEGPNGTGAPLGIFAPDPVVNAGTPKDVWTFGSLTATAPAGAQSVQFMFFFNNPEYLAGAMYVDDASLTLVAPAIPGDITGPGGTPDGIVNQLDLNIITGNWQKTGTGVAGDITGPTNSPDGIVNQLDLNIITGNWQKTASGGALAPGISAVPEPAAVAALVPLALLSRRRRRGRGPTVEPGTR